MIAHDTADAFASILVDIAQSAEIAPRMLPEDFGPGGRYRLEELVGIGHDSHVYRAVDRHLSKPSTPAYVAVKIRLSGASARTEALVGRSVTHENVVRVIDHGVAEGGESYVVQEWIGGGDLSGLVLPLPTREAARLVCPIARGVQAMHSAGSVHGDLKPSNILRNEDGTPKITDFDVASSSDLVESASGGNLALMAPERLLEPGSPPTPLTDIYALGGLLYYFITGEPPHGHRPEQVLARHHDETTVDVQGLERDLAAICLHALCPDPSARYRSAEAFAEDLERWLARQPIAWTRPSLAHRARLLLLRRPIPVTIGALVVATAVSVAGWIQVSINREIEEQRQAIALAAAQNAMEAANNQAIAARNEANRAAIEQMQAQMRTAIEQFVSSGVVQKFLPNGTGVFPALVWLDYISDCEVLGGLGPVMSREDRIAVLLRLRSHYRETGETGTLADAMAAFSLACVHLEAGEYAAAEPFIAAAEASIASKLAEHDDMRRSVEALRALVAYEVALQNDEAGKASALRDDVIRRRDGLLRLDRIHYVGSLLNECLERHPE